MRLALLAATLLTVTASLPAQILAPQTVLGSLEKAYPGLVRVLNPLEGPAVAVGSQSFVWAEGRLLAPEVRGAWPQFAPQPFYEYPAREPDVARWTDAMVEQAESRLSDRRAVNLRRDPGFFDALWGINSRGTAEANQVRTVFAGLPVTVHRTLVGPLQRIDARLKSARAKDKTLDTFLKSLQRLEGYNWRPIAETQSRSNHAYGVAIDLIPKSYGGKNPYWLWAAQDTPGWYRTAWAARWRPHPTVVTAFEDEGFVWGGKWLLFDTIHFEYRPEILILNGLK